MWRSMGNSYEPMAYDEPRGEKRPGYDIEQLQESETAITTDNGDMNMGFIGCVRDARKERHDHQLITDNLTNGHLLAITKGIQIKGLIHKGELSKARDRVKGHADNVIGNMKLQDEMARYFVHRDIEGGLITRGPWIERETSRGQTHRIHGPRIAC